MVYWMLSSFAPAVLQVLLDKLIDVGVSARKSIPGAETKLGKLKTTLSSVQTFINSADNKLTNEKWQDLLLEFENVAYDAVDLLEEIAMKVSDLHDGKLKRKNKVTRLFSSLFKRAMVPGIDEIQGKFDDIFKVMKRLAVSGSHLDRIASKLQTTSLRDDFPVFGRDDDERKVLNILLSTEESSNADNVSVIPIVGPVGVGKTTLAQLVYHHQETRDFFSLKMWISITRDFDVTKIIKSVIQEANWGSSSPLPNSEVNCLSSLDLLQQMLIKIIQEKKFLLVLDDLWNVKRREWDLLFGPLKKGLKGSKIIVTTGSHKVSSLVGTARPHPLNCLSEEDCWLLLKKEALGERDEGITPELEVIGKKIAKKCMGSPLVARVVGSLLSDKVDECVWKKINESRICDLSMVNDDIIPSLKSGFYRLPPHVRQCFAYCSLFPQGYGFERDTIVRMWMGEGFIMSDMERNIPEDIGRGYLYQLQQSSFLQVQGEKYRIHDALHGLAQSVSGEKFLRMEKFDASRITKYTRHLSLVCEEIQAVSPEASERCKSLRTLLALRANKPNIGGSFALFMRFRRLRVVDFSGYYLQELTGSIGNLKHLRYLDVSNTMLKWLPETTRELRVLQTLRLVNCQKLLYLPKHTGKLKSLLHLELGGNNQLNSMPSGIGKLTGLLTLSEFSIGHKSGQMKQLKNLNNIRGSLCLKQLEKLKKPQEAADAHLADKKRLEKLELRWTSVVDGRNDEFVLDKLISGSHESLKDLVLERYGGRRFPTCVSDPLMFSKLTTLMLYKCENCRVLPPLNQLPKLKTLIVDGMYELVTVDEIFLGDVGGFKSLKNLKLTNMSKLESWMGIPDNEMIELSALTIDNCPRMVILPPLHSLVSLKTLEFGKCTLLQSFPDGGLPHSVESLTIMTCPKLAEGCKQDGGKEWLKIKHIPIIEIDCKEVVHRSSP
ncbi:hypothetical protein ACHQM5_013215 [Ranunculus cassubicifolius]